MSDHQAPDDRFEADVAPTKSWDPRITFQFNLALIGFQAMLGIGHFLISIRARGFSTPWVSLSVALDLIGVLVVAFVTAYFLQVFWRRFIATVAPVRTIDYQEALAVVLMLRILF